MCASKETLRLARNLLHCHYFERSDGLNFREPQKTGTFLDSVVTTNR
jgi:hypothetical protein